MIEKTKDDKVYLVIGTKRRRMRSKTDLRSAVGEFIKDL